jgi:hypothetical protein
VEELTSVRAIALFTMLCASLPAADRPRTIFDVDLTKGSAGPGRVSGGVWDKGWRLTGAKNERIVFDAGAPVANGFFEVGFAVERLPWTSEPRKINYAGLYEESTLNQNEQDGDLFYARTGNESYRFSNVKAAGRRFDRTEHEPRVGANEDWIADGRTACPCSPIRKGAALYFRATSSAVTHQWTDCVMRSSVRTATRD